MRIKKEDEILDEGIRKKIIEEIKSPENDKRKAEHYKRHKCYKDKTRYFVVEELEKQFDQTTVREMSFAIPNISIVKKVINKLATVYNSGAQRSVVNEQGEPVTKDTDTMQKIEDKLSVNQKQKSVNRILKLHKNTVCYVKPCPQEDGSWSVVLQPLRPYLYDVVEDYYDRTKPLVYVLSYYKYKSVQYTVNDPSKEGRSFTQDIKPRLGDGSDQVIADSPDDDNANEKEYIWWSDKYHFTTDETGEIISEDTENPIGKKPFVDYAVDQENSYWSDSGDDLIDSAISINAQVAHINNIGVIQGYGQAYFKGKTIPRNLVLGPNKFIIMEYEENDPTPDFGFASANPPIASLQASAEMQLALLLTTNNLSTKSISTTMAAGADFPSAIAMVIDQAESTEDVGEQRQIFYDKDEQTFKLINKWLNYFSSQNELFEELKGLVLPEDFNVRIKFNDPQVIMSESERLDNIEKRKRLGLNTKEELLRIDQPDLSDKEAKAKLETIKSDRLEMMNELNNNAGTDQNSTDGQDVTDMPDAPTDMSQRSGEPMGDKPKIDVEVALNGAQVASLVEVVQKVALGQLPRESGVNIIANAFSIDQAKAEQMMGSIGKGFKPKVMDENNKDNRPKEPTL